MHNASHLRLRIDCLLKPSRWLNWFYGHCASWQGPPWLIRRVIQWFVQRYQVDLSEAETGVAYPTFNAFFTRALKPGVRPLGPSGHLLSPADGRIQAFYTLTASREVTVKNQALAWEALLAHDQSLVNALAGGRAAVIYLAPRDYHRVHMPFNGTLKRMTYVPGRLLSVNPKLLTAYPDLYARNERVVAEFETTLGPMAVVLVGAEIVGSIYTVWSGAVTPPHGKQQATWDYQDEAIHLKAGDELGHFQMGSTVIVLLGKQRLNWLPQWEADQPIKMGQALGRVNPIAPEQIDKAFTQTSSDAEQTIDVT